MKLIDSMVRTGLACFILGGALLSLIVKDLLLLLLLSTLIACFAAYMLLGIGPDDKGRHP